MDNGEVAKVESGNIRSAGSAGSAVSAVSAVSAGSPVSPVSTSATVRDVAKVAGVSIATVSHVVNNTRAVKPSTRERVEAAIHQVGYRHNMVARELKTGSSGLIGVLIVDYNPFYTDVLKGMEDGVERLGWKFVVASTGEHWDRQKELIHMMVSRRMQGILIAPVMGFDPEFVRLHVPPEIPVILFDRRSGDAVPAIVSQNFEGACKVVDHLAVHGCKTLGVVMSSDDISTMNERRRGFEESALRHGMTLAIACTTPDPTGGYEGTAALFTDRDGAVRPDAVIALNNVMLLGVLKYLGEMGIEVGADVAVIGFDDQPWCEVMSPTITVVQQSAYEMGQQAVDVLHKALAGEPVSSRELAMELRMRRSCGCQMK